jgi:outer membrane protein assembly factor BamB
MTGYRTPDQPILIVAFNGWVFGLDATTGKTNWETHVGGNTVRIAVTDDRVYAVTYDSVTALQYATGKFLWRTKISTTGDTLLIAGDRIYLGGNGKVECLSRDGSYLFVNEFKGKGFGGTAIGVPGLVAQADINT